MQSLRDRYHDSCTLLGILKRIHYAAGFLVTVYLVIMMLLYILLLSCCYFLIFLYDMHYLLKLLCSLTIPFFAGLAVLLTVTPLYHNVVICLLKKHCKDLLEEADLKPHEKKTVRDRVFYPMYADNEYHTLLSYIIEAKQKEFERTYRLNLEVIAALQAKNEYDLGRIRERLQAKSNLALYAFIGGLLLEKFTDSMYTLFDNPLMILLVLTGLLIVIGIIKEIYVWIDKNIIHGAENREITRIHEFSSYLYEKEIEYNVTRARD